MADESGTEKSGCLGMLLALFGGSNEGDDGGGVPGPMPYQSREWFFSRQERSFYGVLLDAVGGEYTVFSKVRIADLLKVPNSADKPTSWRNRITSKHVDFVLCTTDTIQPLLIIELDDKSHDREHRQDRDTFVDQAFAAAGIPILHVPAAKTFSTADLREQIAQAVGAGG